MTATVLLLPLLAALAQGPDSTLAIDTAGFHLRLARASGVAVSLAPEGAEPFDFLPAGRDSARRGDRFYHLGDLTLAWRTAGTTSWTRTSTATVRRAVTPLVIRGALAASDLAPALPADIPLTVHRSWEVHDGTLVLRFEVANRTYRPIEIGALGIPMPFDNILSDHSLDQAHAINSFTDPSISGDAGYVQVTRLTGTGPALVVAPWGKTPLEAWNPLLDEKTQRGITFEGFYEWLALSRAFADSAWANAASWNPPTSVTLAPGEKRSWGVRFLLASGVREIEATLAAAHRPVAVGVPGYVLPQDLDARLFLQHSTSVRSISVEPAGAIRITPVASPKGWHAYALRGVTWGRARVTITWSDGLEQQIHYKVIHPARDVVGDMAHFLTTAQWFERPDDPFGRSPSVISYDYDTKRQVTEDNRAWIAGLGDEGGSGSWLAAVMTQLVSPDSAVTAKLQRFVDGVLWGGLQYADGPNAYGVRKSMFYYEPDSMPAGTYGDSIRYGGWSSWKRDHAMSVGRSYDYPHVAAAHWVLYRNARNHVGLVTNHPWDWYLDRAWRTAEAMVRLAPDYAQFGQMEGTVFVLILADLRREGWDTQADQLEALMRKRAEAWDALAYPYGSEMPWDSTGQEEVYAWCRYFGFDDKALVTLNAILGYMPTVPHWGYNGSARRYWDFQYAGKTRRVERQLHHYGSGLNAIPVLSEFRREPQDLYLLRVGYGGLLGSIANVTEDGFGPSGFHAWPNTLKNDGYSGDYGPGFFGHAINAATYVTKDPVFGWLAFGGNWTVAGETVTVEPRDAGRSRVFIARLKLWLVLEAGTFDEVRVTGDRVLVTLSPADRFTPVARLRVEGAARPVGEFRMERGAYVVPLSGRPTVVELR